MIVEYIRYTAKDPATFLRGYEAARTSLDASTHCLAYELTQCHEEPASFILRIEWDSLAGHLEGFRKSAEFPPFFAAVKPFIDQIQEMRHYALTEIVTRKG
jgi:quinol monooxygenase YgiN